MNWLLLTIGSVLAVSVAGVLQKILMRNDKSNPYSYGIAFHFLLGILNFVFGLLYGAEFSFVSGNIYLLLLVSALWAGTTIFLFKALQLIEASEITIITTLRVVVTIVVAVILLKETFTNQNIVGTIIIIVATLLIVNLKKGFVFNKGFLYAILVSFLAGLAIVVDSMNVQHYDVVGYNTITNFLTGFMILAVRPRSLQQWRHFIQPNFLKKMLPLGIFSTMQGVMYLMALTYIGHTAQVGTIRQASVIVTVLLAIVFLNERDNLARKLIAVVLVTVGVILLG